MEIKTKTMGTVEISDEQIIYLKDGFIGLENFHSFALLDSERPPFIWIQCLEDENLAFVAINPFTFRPDYELDIDDSLLAPLNIETAADALVFALVTIPSDGGAITANLQGPLIINKNTKQAAQIVIDGNRWKTKHDIVAELRSGGRT